MLQSGWHHVLIEIAIEVNWDTHYTHQLLKAERVHELIARAKSVTHHGPRLLVSTSAHPPYVTPQVLAETDFVLLHGNGTAYPDRLPEMVVEVRATPGYTPKPIMFNDDDHFDFHKPHNPPTDVVIAGLQASSSAV